MGANFYSIRPAKLFVGLDQRLAIYIVQVQSSKPLRLTRMHSSRYQRWKDPVNRSYLLKYAAMEHIDINQMIAVSKVPYLKYIVEL